MTSGRLRVVIPGQLDTVYVEGQTFELPANTSLVIFEALDNNQVSYKCVYLENLGIMNLDPQNFIENYRKLSLASPRCGSWSRGSENCDFGDIITVSKDCYMCFNSGNCRNAYHCEDSRALTDCIDCAFCEECELCYECVDCDNCYGCDFCQDCANCNDVSHSYDLRRCKNCIGCVGLRDKEYYIFNEKKTREEYEGIKNEGRCDRKDSRFRGNDSRGNDGRVGEIEEKLEELKTATPRMYVHQYDTTNCTGDYVYHSKNCHMCFDTRHTEDSGYITQANLDMGTKDSYDCGPIPTGMDLCYDVAYSHFLFNCKHLYWCGNLKDCQYCINCLESENLFGCNYLQKKQKGFWILNQKVDEDFYRKIVREIVEILRENGIYTLHDLLHKDPRFRGDDRHGDDRHGDDRHGDDRGDSRTSLRIGGNDISDDVRDRKCEICGDEFELFDCEIEFYRKMDIVFPVYCPNCRADQRFKLRTERKMHKRKCDGCKKTLITTYPADGEYIVYCLDCYWKNIG